ncbi:MAG TPA: amidohydrolase family protein [Terracidiphilus sp.]|nr:amidohydrolase family protein [Terracidiphilus sp.]
MSPQSVAFAGDLAAASPNGGAFDAWAPSYDTENNPLLALERRYLSRLLPDVANRDILDAGCGSGRWLSRLSGMNARSLRGIDASPAMLRIATLKNLPDLELTLCSCEQTPFVDRTFDLMLSSFVLSYAGLESFAREMTRIARAGCDLFLSDMHPETQRRLGWKRVVHNGDEAIELQTVGRSLQEIIRLFASLGWELCVAIEPEFGDPERELFVEAQRLKRFHEAEGLPAIYLLHLRKSDSEQNEAKLRRQIAVRSARCVLGPHETAQATLQIAAGRITHILTSAHEDDDESCAHEIDLSGYLLLPGFINAHDHLEFALFPRLGNPPYANASEWARDIHEMFADAIATHRAVPKDVRQWWGALRNLLCGVTTVCHHNPSEPEFERDDFPLRVVRNFGWDHSLAFGADLRSAHSSTPQGAPFIVHACEGIDAEARREIWDLDHLGVLDSNTVLIHGLAIDERGLDLMRRSEAALVICPSSNQFLFAETPHIKLIRGIRRVALGSDSPLTAIGDLLDEARFAIDACNVSPDAAYAMVTETPASILRLKSGEGAVRVAGHADLIAIQDTGEEPAARLKTLSAADIELVMIGGRVQLASECVLKRLPAFVTEGLEPLSVGGITRWLRAPVEDLLASAEQVLGRSQVRLGGKPVCLPASAEAHHAC